MRKLGASSFERSCRSYLLAREATAPDVQKLLSDSPGLGLGECQRSGDVRVSGFKARRMGPFDLPRAR